MSYTLTFKIAFLISWIFTIRLLFQLILANLDNKLKNKIFIVVIEIRKFKYLKCKKFEMITESINNERKFIFTKFCDWNVKTSRLLINVDKFNNVFFLKPKFINKKPYKEEKLYIFFLTNKTQRLINLSKVVRCLQLLYWVAIFDNISCICNLLWDLA